MRQTEPIFPTSLDRLMERYMMESGTKCHFYMDGAFHHTFFYYKHHTTCFSSDGEYHDLGDADGIIVLTHPRNRRRLWRG
jgi:hypothetical protein